MPPGARVPESSKETLDLPSDLFQLCFSVASNMGRFNGGQGVDTILERALAILAKFPDDPAYAKAKVS